MFISQPATATRFRLEMAASACPQERAALEQAAALLQTRIEERCPARRVAEGRALTLRLALAPGLGAEGFQIVEQADGALSLRGNDPRGLLYAVGKFLHTSQYGPEGLHPSAWRGGSVPQGLLRGIYFASHFYNWYHVAPQAELARYVEDLALWGVNTLTLAFPMVNLDGWDDPATEQSLRQINRILDAARCLGLKVGLMCAPNQDFKRTRAEFKAVPLPDPLGRRGNLGNNLCPSLPGAQAYLLDNLRTLLRRLGDAPLDYLCFWPYDEGGCACERCAPWGANGFLKLSQAMAAVARQAHPALQVILSTWMFDTPPEGEWQGLQRALDAGNDWVNYLLADAHEDFPAYPLEHPLPGGLPLLNFPEISMWGLFPWGGFGATPLPGRFERLWRQVKHRVRGGLPYSEGIYEDLNKVVVTQFYWDAERSAEQTLREYIAYEYSAQVVDEVLTLIALIEKSHTAAAEGQPVALADVNAAWALAEQVDGQLTPSARNAWRWRILYLRALLDQERYRRVPEGQWPWRKPWGLLLEDSPRAQAALRELVTLYHAMPVKDDAYPQHLWVRPPLKG